MKLHYSQTTIPFYTPIDEFDYHMKLHYSQTKEAMYILILEFDYHMKLHYSQTFLSASSLAFFV